MRRFVLLSALWSDRDPGPVIFRVKRKTEDHLLASGLDYAILRPATFASGPSSLIGILGPTVERWGLAFVPRPDPSRSPSSVSRTSPTRSSTPRWNRAGATGSWN